MKKSPRCFVAMPFRAELNYFFLYVQRYLQEKHGIQVERGDERVLTKPLMDKIREQILESDVVIGDISYSNPNVFYELGIAHAHGKPIIFLTQHAPEEAPVDIRQFESIQYNLSRHEEFFARLDSAIQNVFVEKYRKLHADAVQLLKDFNAAQGVSHAIATLDTFLPRVMRMEKSVEIPSDSMKREYAEFLLPLVLNDTPDIKTMNQIVVWVGKVN